MTVAADKVHGIPAPNPLLNRNAYPAPGEAAKDKERFKPEGSMR